MVKEIGFFDIRDVKAVEELVLALASTSEK